jgi:predicted RNA-binding protein associated with RNAse of E/G family
LLPKQSLAVSRMAFHPHRTNAVDWYIETDLIDVSGGTWNVRDGYLDVCVVEGLRYDVEDAGELADAVRDGDIPLSDALEALRALDLLCQTLRTNGCSGHALLRQFAPSLPPSRLSRDPSGVFART